MDTPGANAGGGNGGNENPTGSIGSGGAGATDVFAAMLGAQGEMRGDRIGPYTLVEQLGEGGFGSVWLAERREPIVQQVAVKIIKPGMDSFEVLARFEQERQALALMNHPNIAKVFDAGTTEKGRPYFAMEHVPGESITRYCDRRRLSIRERLALFVPVCDAVQHAHQKGLIHRDIKPSNVLVSEIDGKHMPKVIDFGIAKAISHTLTDKTIFTERGVLLGTPEYMSPEQADMGSVDVDTRTDVYALGVMLYELLSGVLPFDPKELRSRGYAEIRRIIREEEPPTPSRRLSGLDEATVVKIAEARRAVGDALERALRRELEWIPLKAMRKERSRRYDTPRDLGRDIERYLSGQALEAAPESRWYRARKFVRRNRGAVAAGGLIAASLVLGAGVAGWRWQLEMAARRDAQSQRDAAYGLIEFVDRSVLRRLGAATGVVVPVPRKTLDDAARDVEARFSGTPALRSRLRNVLARTYLAAGQTGGALAQTRGLEGGAVDIERAEDVAAVEVRLEATYRERSVAAEDLAATKSVLDRLDAAGRGRTAEAIDLRAQYAGALKWNERLEEARDQYERVIADNRALGAERAEEEAVAAYDLALVRVRILRRDEKTIGERAFRAGLIGERAVLLDLARQAEESAVFGPEHQHTLACRVEAAAVCAAMGDFAEAIEGVSAVLPVMDEALGIRHARTAEARSRVGQWLIRAGRFAEAEEVLRSSVRAMRFTHGAGNIDVLRVATSLAVALEGQGRHDEEWAEFETAFAAAEEAGLSAAELAKAAGWRERMLAKRKDGAAEAWARRRTALEAAARAAESK